MYCPGLSVCENLSLQTSIEILIIPKGNLLETEGFILKSLFLLTVGRRAINILVGTLIIINQGNNRQTLQKKPHPTYNIKMNKTCIN